MGIFRYALAGTRDDMPKVAGICAWLAGTAASSSSMAAVLTADLKLSNAQPRKCRGPTAFCIHGDPII
jgi:hypothetical protein